MVMVKPRWSQGQQSDVTALPSHNNRIIYASSSSIVLLSYKPAYTISGNKWPATHVLQTSNYIVKVRFQSQARELNIFEYAPIFIHNTRNVEQRI